MDVLLGAPDHVAQPEEHLLLTRRRVSEQGVDQKRRRRLAARSSAPRIRGGACTQQYVERWHATRLVGAAPAC